MNLGSCNQSIERTFSFTVGVAYTCIKATFALRIQSVNIVSIRATLFSPLFAGVPGELSKLTPRLLRFSALIGSQSKGCVPSQERGSNKAGVIQKAFYPTS